MSIVEMVREPELAADDELPADITARSSRRGQLDQRYRAWDGNWAGVELDVDSDSSGPASDGSVDRPAGTPVHPIVGRRGLRAFVRALVRRFAPSPARYRLMDGAAASWDVADWHTLMLSIEYLRDEGFEMSTLRVESITA